MSRRWKEEGDEGEIKFRVTQPLLFCWSLHQNRPKTVYRNKEFLIIKGPFGSNFEGFISE